jgi:hypothetical protein
MRLGIIMLLCLFILACEKPVDLNLGTKKQIPVINCLYTTSKVFSVQIAYTYSSKESPKWEENAELELLENGISKGFFAYLDSGRYELNYFPQTGKKYKIMVNIPNYGKIWAEDSLPESAIIGESYYTLGKSYIQVGSESGPAFDFYATIVDNQTHDNFYEAYLMLSPFVDGVWKQKISFTPWDKSMINNAVLLAEGETDYYAPTNVRGLIFSDNLFANESVEFKLRTLYYGNVTNYKSDIYRYYFVCESVSKNYYLYKKSWITHAFNQASNVEITGDFLGFIELGEPVELYSNMKGEVALGIFAGFNTNEKLYQYVP